jgi:hypothetical protein
MSKTRRRMVKEDTVAAWLCDAFGADGETMQNFRPDARDLLRFMRANGWEFKYDQKLLQEDAS